MSKFSVQVERLVSDVFKTQEKLSQESGVDRTTINKIINGTSPGTAGNARDLAKVAPSEFRAPLLQSFFEDFLKDVEGIRFSVGAPAPAQNADALTDTLGKLSSKHQAGVISLIEEVAQGVEGAGSYLDLWCGLVSRRP